MRLPSRSASLVIAVSLVALASVLGSSGCIALVCFDSDPCAHGNGGASSSSLSSASATATSSTSTTSSSTTSDTSSSSTGGGACSDAANCGAPGIDCLGGACVNCLCEPVALDFGAPTGRIAAGDVDVYVAAGGDSNASLYAVPKTFDPANPAAGYSMTSIPDPGGFIAASGSNVAYSPSTDAHLVLCAAGSCLPTAQPFDPHGAGLAFDLNALQFGVAAPINGIGTLKPFSTAPSNIVILINDTGGGTGMGVHTVRSLLGVTYWSDYDGCLYAQSNNVVGSAFCLGLNGADLHPADFVVGAQGLFVAQTNGNEIYRVDVNVTQQKGAPTFIPDDNQVSIRGTGPLALDAKLLFVGQAQGIAIYDYSALGSTLVKTLTTSGAVAGIDASDTRFLYYTADQKLYRWRKPKP